MNYGMKQNYLRILTKVLYEDKIENEEKLKQKSNEISDLNEKIRYLEKQINDLKKDSSSELTRISEENLSLKQQLLELNVI